MKRSVALALAAALGGIVVGGAVWFAKPAVTAAPPMPAPTTTVPTSVATPATPAATVPNNMRAAPPPWAGTAGGAAANSSPAGLAAAIHATPADAAKTQARDAIRTKLMALTAGGRHPTPAEMNDVLGDLERVEGSSTVSGVNLAALRNNLTKVSEMQRLAAELTAQTQRPGGGDKQRTQEILSRVKQLQSEMQLNIAVPAPVPAPQK